MLDIILLLSSPGGTVLVLSCEVRYTARANDEGTIHHQTAQ